MDLHRQLRLSFSSTWRIVCLSSKLRDLCLCRNPANFSGIGESLCPNLSAHLVSSLQVYVSSFRRVSRLPSLRSRCRRGSRLITVARPYTAAIAVFPHVFIRIRTNNPQDHFCRRIQMLLSQRQIKSEILTRRPTGMAPIFVPGTANNLAIIVTSSA